MPWLRSAALGGHTCLRTAGAALGRSAASWVVRPPPGSPRDRRPPRTRVRGRRARRLLSLYARVPCLAMLPCWPRRRAYDQGYQDAQCDLAFELAAAQQAVERATESQRGLRARLRNREAREAEPSVRVGRTALGLGEARCA